MEKEAPRGQTQFDNEQKAVPQHEWRDETSLLSGPVRDFLQNTFSHSRSERKRYDSSTELHASGYGCSSLDLAGGLMPESVQALYTDDDLKKLAIRYPNTGAEIFISGQAIEDLKNDYLINKDSAQEETISEGEKSDGN